MSHRFAPLFLAAACTGDDPTAPRLGTADPTDPTVPVVVDTTEPACANPVVRATPQDGESAVYHRAPIEAELAEPDPTARLVVSAAGVEAAGSSAVDGAVVRWEGVLETDTDYRMLLTHACGSQLILFSTSRIGEPVEVDLVGRTWTLDFAGGTWVEPVGAGGAMSVLLSQFRVLLSVTGPPDGGIVPLAAGVGYDGHQNVCVPTLDLSETGWDDPHFSVEADAFEMATEEFSLTVQDFATSGIVSPDGERVAEAAVSGLVDTRDLGASFQLGNGPGAVCELLGTLGATCVPCADGLQTCLPMNVQRVAGVASPVPLVEVTAEDVLADPTCGG